MRFLKDFKIILQGNILILFITWILLDFGSGMVHRFDGLYFSSLGASDIVLGFMGSITFGVLALLQIPGGYIADTFGRRRIVVIFTFVMAFSMLIFALAPSWQFIIVGLVIENLALLYQPALLSIVMDSLPQQKRAEGFGIINLAVLPSIGAPIIGGYLIMTYGVINGMRLGYFILFILSLSAAMLRVFLKETLKERKVKKKFFESFKVLRRIDKRAKILIVIGLCISASTGLSGYFVVKYAITYTSSLMFGLAMTVLTLLGGIGAFPLGKLADSHGKEKYFIVGIFILSFSLLLFSIPGVIFLFAYATLSGVGAAMYQPANSGLIADYVRNENRGRFTGTYLFLSYISAMAFSALGGYIYSFDHHLLFLLSSFLMFLATLIGALFLMNKRQIKDGDFSQKI